ncbi:uncharacterized protein PAC_03807 [Phialocephala subalpina]|uniref:Gastric mucin n=1 Tax=Phialocephala subalpina TaxID=576137 RepID=A0A1L7WMD6_9HELO|nr:uncharacterized protein PAC_03807 [Phialocephala subalpina]
MAVLELEPEQLGKLVALEGDSETIETQLRLLPPSQKILILPTLQSALPQDVESDKDAFNARTFIRDVHRTFTERTETARAFLQSSTSTQPRLAFINGGSVSARATCITRICANMTNGDMKEAETIFDEAVKDGVAGLMKQDIAEEEEIAIAIEDDEGVKGEEGVQDPSVRAMKAADSLDRETEGLQLEDIVNAVPGLEKAAQSQATGTRVWTGAKPGKSSQATNSPSKAVFTNRKGDDIVRTVLTVPSRSQKFTVEEKRTTFGPHYSISTPATASTTGPVQTPGEIEKDDDYDELEFASPGDESLFSVPHTPAIVYEEATLVDVQSGSPTKAVKRSQSVDMFYPSNSEFLAASSSPKPLKHTTSDYHLRRPTSHVPEREYANFQTLPRTTFVKASQTTIKKSPTLSSSMRSNSSLTQDAPPRVFVDRGEDAFQPSVELVGRFEPVFPVVEDLIIHLVDDNVNEILETVIRSYKDGSYPIMPKPASTSSKDSLEASTSPVSVSNEQHERKFRPESYLTTETDDTGYHRRGEYDPYDHDSYPPDIKRQWPPMPPLPTSVRFDSMDSSVEPPTPTLTPPPQASGVAEKFIDFTAVNSNNAINVQNSLRQLLSLKFPAGEHGYSQYLYPVPEADRLWKPVFRNDQNTSVSNDTRNVDQIIAFGCEDRVKKDFFFQISGQVERLGTKRDGVNRSGRLDIRYLIANAMQHFPSLSPSSTFNPLSNSQALAALLVPQIEAYFAINTSTRLLVLQYPASQLPTVFALRNLLGSDLLKIAGVLDSLASDPPSMSRPRTATANPLSNEAVSQRARSHSRLNSLQRTNIDDTRADSLTTLTRQTSVAGSVRSSLVQASAAFAKADYLLPSTATDTEITTFLTSIWKCLMEKSTFYTPEPEPKPIIVERPPMPPPPTPTGSARDIRRERYRDRDEKDTDRDSTYRPPSSRQGGSQSKISRLTGGSATSPPIPRSIYASSIISTSTARPSTRHRDRDRDRDTDYEPSITSTRHKYAASIASTKTTASEKERRKDREWENFYIGDEDSEDDAFDRMIMGRSGGQRIVPEPMEVRTVVKRDKRKALKWLGLA